MKQKFFIILGVISITLSLTTLGFSEITQYVYGGSQHDFASKIIKTPDSGFLILGYTNSYGAGNRDVYLVKINSDYEQQWQKTYGGTSAEYAFDIIETYDNNYLILAQTHSYEIAGNSKPDIYLIKVDIDGNVLDAKTLRYYSIEEYGYVLIKTNDNNYLISGRIQTWYKHRGYSSAYMVKINQQLYPIWIRGYPANTSAGKVYQQEDGYLVIGNYYNDTNNGIYIFKTDFNGYFSWDEIIQGTDNIFAQDVKMTKNNKLVFPGSTLPYGGTHSLYLLKTDLTGQVDLERTYPNEGYNETATDMLITKDGQYLIFGHVYKPETNYDFFLMKTDTNGNEIWKKVWGGDQGDYAGIVEQLEDGTYQMMAGTSSWGAGLADMYVGLYQNQHIIEELNTALTEQEFDEEIRVKEYVFTLEEQTEVGIISGGSLDLRAVLFDEERNLVVENSGYTDVGSCPGNQYGAGNAQTNFMLRADLAPGTYVVEVYPETEETLIEDQFSVVFLKRPDNSEEFFAGMNALLSDNDLTNDYLDIYVKAVFPEFYESVDDVGFTINYFGNTEHYGGICRERQCKALTNFYLHEILGMNYMETDDNIWINWSNFAEDENCVAQNDYIIQGNQGVLVFHGENGPVCNDYLVTDKYCYNLDTGIVLRGANCNSEDFVNTRGDVFLQRLGGTITHKGIVLGDSQMLDANWASPMDGRIRIEDNDSSGRSPDVWKISRPQ